MSYLTHFILLALVVGAGHMVIDRIYAGAYERCFKEQRREGLTEGLWCEKPIGFPNCKNCPHYHFYN